MAGLQNIEAFTGHLAVHGNPKLETMGGPGKFPPAYDDLEGKPTQYVWATRNDRLRDLSLFAHLSEMRSVRLARNASLETLEGLENLKKIAGVRLESNPALRSLDALDGVEATTAASYIVDNPSLPECEVKAWMETHPAKGDSRHTAHGNGEGDCGDQRSDPSSM